MTREQRREYAGPDDLRAMQTLAQRVWTPRGRPHVGDIAWGRYSVPAAEDRFMTSLWEDQGTVMAWGWVEMPDYLEMLVDPATPELTGEVLDWFETVAEGPERCCMVMEYDDVLIAALEQASYERQTDGPFFTNHVVDLDDLADPSLPASFVLRPVERGEVEARAEVHRSSWSEFTSSMTSAAYGRLMDTWPYRSDLDWVVETAGGELVASALGWLDDDNRVGLVEPVGCVPAYRGRGLSAAANLALLHAFRAAGATSAVVRPRGDGAYPVPARLYRSIGFRPVSRSYLYQR